MTGPSNWDAYLQPVSPELRRLMARPSAGQGVTVQVKGPDGKPIQVWATMYPVATPPLPADGLRSLMAGVGRLGSDFELTMTSVKVYRENVLKAFGFPANWQPRRYSPTPRIPMNATLRSALLGTRSTPEQAQGAYLRECRTELESELEALGDAEVGGSMMQRSWDSRVSAVVEYGRWISILVQTYTYTGGAHGSTVVQSFVFDTQTGEEQELRNLVRDDRALATLHGQIASRLLSEYTDALFEDQAALLRAYVANRAEQPALLARGELGYATSTTFLLGPTGLRVFFQQYEVAPYAAGMPTVDLPFAAWQALAIDELRP